MKSNSEEISKIEDTLPSKINVTLKNFDNRFDALNNNYLEKEQGFLAARKDKNWVKPYLIDQKLNDCNNFLYDFVLLQKDVKNNFLELKRECEIGGMTDEVRELFKDFDTLLQDIENRVSQTSSHSTALSNKLSIASTKFTFWTVIASFVLAFIALLFSIYTYVTPLTSSNNDYNKESIYRQSVSDKFDDVNSKIQALQKSMEENSKTVSDRLSSIEASGKKADQIKAQK
jgi:methyl-accepting chemotaxis protein